jgi:hypothetical protein
MQDYSFKLGKFPVPTQHGAWAMWLVPATMGAALTGTWRWSVLLILLGFMLIFLSHQPAIRALRRWKFRRILDDNSINWAIVLGGSGVGLLAALFSYYRLWFAMILGFVVALALLTHISMTLNKKQTSIPGEIIGVLGLTASAPLIYLYLYEILDARGWVLWAINLLYFSGSIFYVKLKLRYQPAHEEPQFIFKLRFGLPLIMYTIFVFIFMISVTALRHYSWYFVVAFIPFLIKISLGIVNWNTGQDLKAWQIGLNEIIHAALFAILSVIGFYKTGV